MVLTHRLDEVHTSSDGASDNVDALVGPNIPTMPSKSFKFSCVEYNFMVIPIESYSSESSEFFAMIQHVISSDSFFTGRFEFIHESNYY